MLVHTVASEPCSISYLKGGDIVPATSLREQTPGLVVEASLLMGSHFRAVLREMLQTVTRPVVRLRYNNRRLELKLKQCESHGYWYER